MWKRLIRITLDDGELDLGIHATPRIEHKRCPGSLQGI